MAKIIRKYTVLVVEESDLNEAGQSPEDNIRDSLLDAWGFPILFGEHPEYINVRKDFEWAFDERILNNFSKLTENSCQTTADYITSIDPKL